jgi:RNA polymerase sigma-70 factor (ECF subfamily)
MTDLMTNVEPHSSMEFSENQHDLAIRFERDAIPLKHHLDRRARQLTSCHADAEDLVQDTLVKAHASFHMFCAGTYLKAWLLRIMYHTWIEGYRRSCRRPAEVLAGQISDEEPHIDGRHASIRSLSFHSAESEALDRWNDSRIMAAVNELPNDLGKVIRYAYVDRIPFKDIAQLMEVPVGTVMSRAFRARAKLRGQLSKLAVEYGYGRDEVAV